MVDLEDGGGEPAEEGAVMGHRDDGAAVAAQLVLQPRHRLLVEVVRRLVQEEQLRRRRQHAGQGQAGPLAARQAAEGPVPGDAGQAQAVHGGLHPRVGFVPATGLERGEQRGVGVHVGGLGGAEHALLQVAQLAERLVHGVLDGVARRWFQRLAQVPDAVGGDDHLAAVGPVRPGDDPEQGGLAGPVLADDTGFLTGGDGEGDLIEYGALTVRFGHVAKGDLAHEGSPPGLRRR
jgi:hypothetical protein